MDARTNARPYPEMHAVTRHKQAETVNQTDGRTRRRKQDCGQWAISKSRSKWRPEQQQRRQQKLLLKGKLSERRPDREWTSLVLCGYWSCFKFKLLPLGQSFTKRLCERLSLTFADEMSRWELHIQRQKAIGRVHCVSVRVDEHRSWR